MHEGQRAAEHPDRPQGPPVTRGTTNRLRHWLLPALAALCLLGHVCPAFADSSVIVLSVRALDGDDDLAHRLSAALRSGAAKVPGWQVNDSEVSLAQMSLAHGCNEPNAKCMADIAATLGVDRLLYGTSSRVDEGVQISLHNFDAVTGHVEGSYEESVPMEGLTPEAIDQTAALLALQVAGQPASGSIEVRADRPGARVLLDGRPAGELDAEGTLRIEGVTAGTHHVSVTTDDARDDRKLTVPAGATAQLKVNLAAPAPAAPPAVETPPELAPIASATADDAKLRRLRVAGWTHVGIAAGLFVGTVAVWARLGAINNDPDLRAYRDMFVEPDSMGGGVADVCTLARMNNPGTGTMPGLQNRVEDLCDKGDRLEKLQWVFLIPAIATAVTGTALLLRERGLRKKRQLSFSPYGGPGQAGLTAHLRF